MLKLTKEVYSTIAAHGAASYPYEGCGLLLGTVEDETNTALKAYPVPNRWHDAEERRVRFRIDESDMLEAELAALENGLDVIGIFHSHPDHLPLASPRDLNWATWAGYSYLITEIKNGAPGTSRSWQLLPDRTGFVEEKMVVLDS